MMLENLLLRGMGYTTDQLYSNKNLKESTQILNRVKSLGDIVNFFAIIIGLEYSQTESISKFYSQNISKFLKYKKLSELETKKYKKVYNNNYIQNNNKLSIQDENVTKLLNDVYIQLQGTLLKEESKHQLTTTKFNMSNTIIPTDIKNKPMSCSKKDLPTRTLEIDLLYDNVIKKFFKFDKLYNMKLISSNINNGNIENVKNFELVDLPNKKDGNVLQDKKYSNSPKFETLKEFIFQTAEINNIKNNLNNNFNDDIQDNSKNNVNEIISNIFKITDRNKHDKENKPNNFIKPNISIETISNIKETKGNKNNISIEDNFSIEDKINFYTNQESTPVKKINSSIHNSSKNSLKQSFNFNSSVGIRSPSSLLNPNLNSSFEGKSLNSSALVEPLKTNESKGSDKFVNLSNDRKNRRNGTILKINFNAINNINTNSSNNVIISENNQRRRVSLFSGQQASQKNDSESYDNSKR